MPTVANLERNRAIRDYFKERYATKLSDPNAAREDIQRRFGVDDKHWYRLRPQFAEMIDTYRSRSGNGTLVAAGPEPTVEAEPVVLELPTDLSGEAKEAVNQLLQENHRLATESTMKDVELAGTRSQLASSQGRIRILKEVASRLLDSI